MDGFAKGHKSTFKTEFDKHILLIGFTACIVVPPLNVGSLTSLGPNQVHLQNDIPKRQTRL